MTLIFNSKAVIEFIGDSITDSDRQTPINRPLGQGYVQEIHCLLQSAYPHLGLDIVNKGVSGNQIRDLQNRWKTDVLDINPDWLFIFIGINDAWRFSQNGPEKGVSLGEFTKIYQQLITITLSKSQAQILLIPPFLAETDQTDPLLSLLRQYQATIKDMGVNFNLPVIPIQPAFDQAMCAKPANFWTTDRVHPTKEGHMLIALTILKACGFVV